jgi:sterol desaturase/sphingolipid hydroxylase (fatty acid hydroxylase superfamily)
MESFLLFFEQLATWQKLVWIMLCLGGSWLLEGSFPLVQLRYRKLHDAGVNAAFLATTLVINTAFSSASLVAANWTTSSSFGLLHLFELPVLAELLIAVVLLDLTAQYWAHYLLHQIKWMWRLHVVHHSDTKVDVTTGTRLHPGDFAVRETFALASLIVIGAPLAYYVVYRLTTIFFTFVTHANISPPRWLDASLSLVFVTPNMHKFHHHFERPWTDTNYGGILSIWDRMFGTFVYENPLDVQYGIDVDDPSLDEDVVHQFKLPFLRGVRLDRDADPRSDS